MKRSLHNCLRPALLLLLGFFAATPTIAQFQDGGSPDESPGEDIGTVPAHSGDPDDTLGDPAGRFILVGRPYELHLALTDLKGSGQFAFAPVGSGGDTIRVSIYGDFQISLDPVAVRTFGIKVCYQVEPGPAWTAQASLGDWTSRPFELQGGVPLEIPLGFLREDRPGPLILQAASPAGGSVVIRIALRDGLYRVRVRTRG